MAVRFSRDKSDVKPHKIAGEGFAFGGFLHPSLKGAFTAAG